MTTRPARRRSFFLRALVVLGLLGAVAGGALGWLYHRHVVLEPGEAGDPTAVRQVIAQESPVFYRDGHTRVGVFFDDEHRRYVPWERIPRAWAAAIVAAEDDAFWSHPGFDPVHIARAVRDNLRAGRLVAGGSTLTQQTAKNLFYRPDRSMRSKLIEALQTLRLERHFAKEELLTFYANQFHVTGNGRGLGIAARHFFDKEVEELSVAESAFLAGLVKAPSRYDPFLGDAERRARAVERAHERTGYVLRRIVEEPAERLAGPFADGSDGSQQAYLQRVAEVRGIQDEARRLLDEGFTLTFEQGRFRFASSAVLDEVRRRLAEPPFDEVLEALDIEDPSTAGLRVITTLDPEAQKAATWGLWHHLTEVGVMLEELGIDAFRHDGPPPSWDPERVPEPLTFRTARIAEIVEEEGRRHAVADLGGTRCVIDRDAFVRAAVAVERGRVGSSRARTSTEAVNAFVDALGVDAVVWVSIRAVGPDGAVCDLEVRPELQGAAVVLDQGEIRAMVGGNDNLHFNRATALRQLGSTWKPLVFHAALELGWTPEAALDNRRGVFPFSTTYYWPRADHESADEVSLAWAGVRSENLASVWLLYHLTDRLDHEATHQLASTLGLLRAEDESEADYRLRMQRAGVLPTPSRVREADFLRARREVLASLPRARHPDDAVGLSSLLYGWGFDAEARRVSSSWQRDALAFSWLGLTSLRERCETQHALLVDAVSADVVPPAGALPDLSVRRVDDTVEVACGGAPEDFGPITPGVLAPEPGPFSFLGVRGQPPAVVSLSDVVIGRRLHVGTLDAVASAMERHALAREVAGADAPGLYDPELLLWHGDMRVLLGLRYVARLAARYGVRTGVQEVLSLPLGASEITLEEAALVYGGLVSGASWRFPGQAAGRVVSEPAAGALLIAELQDVDGNTLYRAEPVREEVLSPEVGAMTHDILRQVVVHGTGARARDAVRLAGSSLPLAGKTGTTNEFRNAAFLGVAPRVDERGVTGDVVVGVYVGYDDNRPMRRGRILLSGSSGALPAWIGTVRGLAGAGLLGEPRRAPEGGWTLPAPDALVTVPVDPARGGLPAEPGAEGVVEVLTRADRKGRRDPTAVAPSSRPVRIAPRGDQVPEVPPDGAEAPRSVWAAP